MSWKASAFVKDIRAGLTRSEKLVLLVLADYHEDKRMCAWPSIKALAEDSLMTCRRVQQLLRRIEAKGILVIEERPNQTNVYRFVGLDIPATGEAGFRGEIPSGVKSPTLPPEISHTPPLKSPTYEPPVEPPVEPSEGARLTLLPVSAQLAHFGQSEPAKPARRRNTMPPLPGQEFIARMRVKYAELADFAMSMDAWENHTSRKRHASQERSLENWLRKDLLAQQERASRMGRSAQVAHIGGPPGTPGAVATRAPLFGGGR